MEAAKARFVGTGAVIDDPAEASRVHNKGAFGVPQQGGGLALDLLETVYLLDTHRIALLSESGEAVPFAELLARCQEGSPAFGTAYGVYRDLRERGTILRREERPGPGGAMVRFLAYDRGDRPGKSAPSIRVLGCSERTPLPLDDVFEEASTLGRSGATGVLSVVDEEGDLTHYRFGIEEPKGPSPVPDGGPAVQGTLLDDRVLVEDAAAAKRLVSEAAYGRMLGDRLQLSLVEAAFLQGKGRLVVREPGRRAIVAPSSLEKRGEALDHHAMLRTRTYGDLRGRGLLVKTGFKFGTHFRAYDTPPETSHARYLVHAIPPGFVGHWPEVSRAVRLAHGVRKELLFARVADGADGKWTIRYLALARYRP